MRKIEFHKATFGKSGKEESYLAKILYVVKITFLLLMV
jgi:hypothetical protein